MEYNDGITFNRYIKRPVVDKIQNGSDCPCYGAAAAVLQQPPAAGRQENRRSNELNWFQGRTLVSAAARTPRCDNTCIDKTIPVSSRQEL